MRGIRAGAETKGAPPSSRRIYLGLCVGVCVPCSVIPCVCHIKVHSVCVWCVCMQSFAVGPIHPHLVAKLAHNRIKNRFANIFPCKSTTTYADLPLSCVGGGGEGERNGV